MNETLLVITAALDLCIVMAAFMRGHTWLYATIVINLLLITIFGAKLEMIFGHITNVGNAYYACVFFAIYLLMEHGSPWDGAKAIWIGVGSVIAFAIFAQLTLLMQSAPPTAALSALMTQVFSFTPRIALASLTAFICAQYLNVVLYVHWREPIESTHWWLRMLVLIMTAQLVDSLIFFSIAFVGTVASSTVLDTVIFGYLIKVGIGIISTPLIYLSHHMRIDSSEAVQIA
jgi:uncharacterized integral membrane protein (TIGR00697 family)